MKVTLEAIIQCLTSDHVQENKFRLGALGSGDIDMAVSIAEQALENLEVADRDNAVRESYGHVTHGG